MNLSALNRLINKLGEKKCAEEFSALVDMANHTSDPKVLVQNKIYEAMLKDRANEFATTDSQQAKTSSTTVTLS